MCEPLMCTRDAEKNINYSEIGLPAFFPINFKPRRKLGECFFFAVTFEQIDYYCFINARTLVCI